MSCCIMGCPNSGPSPSKETTYHLFPHPEKDAIRFRQWLNMCNDPRLDALEPILVQKRHRICRRHFDSECMNGGCRRLLNTAIPTLHMNGLPEKNLNLIVEETTDLENEYILAVKKELTLIPVGIDETKNDQEDHFEIIPTSKPTPMSVPTVEIFETRPSTKRKSDGGEDVSAKSKYGYLKDIHSKHHTKKVKLSTESVNISEHISPVPMFIQNGQCSNNSQFAVPERLIRNILTHESRELVALTDNDTTNEYELLDVEDSKYFRVPLSEETFKKWRKDFYKCEKNVLAQNVCSRVDPFEVALSRRVLENTQHVFTYKVESEGKPMTNQKNSGRCWIFAALNSIRIPFMKQNNLDEFEFSQTHLFYWDKIERCHYFLNNIIETAAKGEEVTGRLVSFLLKDPTCDGGQWDMLTNLINKYGLMPKKCYPETYCSEASIRMNAVLKSKLREYTKVLRDLVAAGKSDEEVKAKLNEQMSEIYRIVGICLGIPDDKFTWEYYDKSKAYHSIGPIKPIDFYLKYVKPIFNVDDKVCLVTDPRSTSCYQQAYTIDCLGNIVGGRPVLYNNQPVELLMDLVATSLKNGEPVWFGCEVSKRFAAKQGIQDLNVHDFKLLFGTDIQTTLSKGERMIYGESAMTHAMTFTAVSCDDDGKPTKYRVENSWGEDRGEKGYLIMSAAWFKEFVFEIVVDKSIVPPEVMDVFQQTPIVLPAWDPMGTLAKN